MFVLMLKCNFIHRSVCAQVLPSRRGLGQLGGVVVHRSGPLVRWGLVECYGAWSGRIWLWAVGVLGWFLVGGG
jgi:hypothetical protein